MKLVFRLAIITLLGAQAKQPLHTFIHSHRHIMRAFFVVPLARPIYPSVFSIHDAHVRMSMSIYAEWSVSNIRSLKSSIYIDRLAFNRWSSSPLPSSFPFVSSLYVFFNLNLFGGALLIDGYKCYQKTKNEKEKNMRCRQVSDQFNSVVHLVRVDRTDTVEERRTFIRSDWWHANPCAQHMSTPQYRT